MGRSSGLLSSRAQRGDLWLGAGAEGSEIAAAFGLAMTGMWQCRWRLPWAAARGHCHRERSAAIPGFVPAQTLADLLRESGIHNRIVIVSACYSGGFIPALQDERMLVITAARADRTSFGCADENDFTYFGRALFQASLTDAPQTQGLTDAFAQAVTLVTQWEAELSGDRTSDDAAAAAPVGAAGPLAAMLGGKRPVLLSEPQMQGAPAYVEWIDAQWRAWRRGALARP